MRLLVLGVVTFLGTPWGVWRLRQAGAVLAPAPVIPITAAGSVARPTGPAAVTVLPVAAGAAPDLEPVVTPSRAKAGEVRRVQGTPCHECTCCTRYATRLRDAHGEIDRLRDEVTRNGDAWINYSAALEVLAGASPS